MTARTVYVPAGRMAEHVPEHPERTSVQSGKGALDFDVRVRTWPSRGAMLAACRMSDTGKLGATPLRDYLASRYPAALAYLASHSESGAAK